jgi:hypothetical protein
VKPEWLEDELLAAASDEARVLSVGLILLADDYGNGRASIATIAASVWRYALERDDGAKAPEVLAKASRAFRELLDLGFIGTWSVGGQRYFAIRNWARHQRVDKPGKPLVPKPPADLFSPAKLENPTDSGKPREPLATTSGAIPESLAPDLRPTTNDQEGIGPGPSARTSQLPTDLKARAESWLRDPQLAALTDPNPQAWPETVRLVDTLAEVFGGKRQPVRGSGDPRMAAMFRQWADGRTTDELEQAIRGAGRDEHLLKNPQLQTLTTVLRDANQVDRFTRLLTVAPVVSTRPGGERAADGLTRQLARVAQLKAAEQSEPERKALP